MSKGIYKITNVVNGKFYIGSSIDIKKRWARHLYDLRNGKHHNKYLQRAWDKNGECNFVFNIIVESDDLETIEQELLDGYFGTSSCYNINPYVSGGDLLTSHPDRKSIIKKITKAVQKNMSQLTKEEKKKKWGKSGKDNPNYKHPWNEESRKKMSEFQKNRFRGPEERAKISKARKKYFSTQENRYKQSEIKKKYFVENPNAREKLSELAMQRTGDKNPFYGKKHSEETKKKISDKNKGQYCGNQERPIIIDGVWYKSVSEAARQIGVVAGTIIHRVKSKNKKFEGYFYEEDKR